MPVTQPTAAKPIPATPEALSKVLGLKPVLWVGAGLSFAAGYPSTWQLVQAMAKVAIDPIDTSLPFFAVADAFVESLGEAALGDLLQRHMGLPRQPTASHRAIARLAGAGHFHAIITTNYDPLLEHALHEEGVRVLLQPLEDNAPTTGDDELRLLKIHGSYSDWKEIVLSGQAYARCSQRYPFQEKQLYGVGARAGGEGQGWTTAAGACRRARRTLRGGAERAVAGAMGAGTGFR